jgi:hypothetical protein
MRLLIPALVLLSAAHTVLATAYVGCFARPVVTGLTGIVAQANQASNAACIVSGTDLVGMIQLKYVSECVSNGGL